MLDFINNKNQTSTAMSMAEGIKNIKWIFD
jgi:hypothetical protein